MTTTIHHGNCVTVMADMPEASVDAVVCDPPYELGFMGKSWDSTGVAYDPETWRAALRVLKPGGHLLAFGGTRTWHRLAVAVEDAGFEIRDSIAWMYGSGFPKSLDVGKAIDKAAGAAREIVGLRSYGEGQTYGSRTAAGRSGGHMGRTVAREPSVETAPATDDARKWQGWGTALKPAHEPIVVARKPLEGTVAANVLEHGTGALNIDGCRIGTEERTNNAGGASSLQRVSRVEAGYRKNITQSVGEASAVQGRWPANVILDEGQAAALDQQSGTLTSGAGNTRRRPHRTDAMAGVLNMLDREEISYGDTGGASRFFYCSKAPKAERPVVDGVAHATVKPLTLMRYLVRLVTPPGGTVLDPFAGSGTTIEAAIIEGFTAVGIEQDAAYLPLIQERIRRQEEADQELDFGT